MAASQKLSQLLQLADQGPALRAALAEEVAELLVNWPPDYPQVMRGACEALLAKAAHDVDAATRARLRVLLCSQPELASRVLPRESATQGLIETARQGGDLVMSLAARLGIDEKRAAKILEDETGVALAVACKAAGLDRAAFSALALLSRRGRDCIPAYALLDAFDNAPAGEEQGLLRASA
jgi:hypothetical protein